jgi:hypothetical protein
MSHPGRFVTEYLKQQAVKRFDRWSMSGFPCSGLPVREGALRLPTSSSTKNAENGNAGSYIEVVTDRYAVSPLSMKLHESLATLSNS